MTWENLHLKILGLSASVLFILFIIWVICRLIVIYYDYKKRTDRLTDDKAGET